MRGQIDLRERIEHVRVRRRESAFHAVLFLTGASPEEARTVGGIIGLAAADAIPAIRFTGVRSWPDTGEPAAGADPEPPR